MSAHWAPAFHADVAAAMAEAKLDWVASANPLENFPELNLTPEQRALMDRYKDPTMRELVKDTCLPRQFRHDVFVRGARRMSNARARRGAHPPDRGAARHGRRTADEDTGAGRHGGGQRAFEEHDDRRDARADDDRRSAGPGDGTQQPGRAGEHAGGHQPVPDRDAAGRRAARVRQSSQPRARRAGAARSPTPRPPAASPPDGSAPGLSTPPLVQFIANRLLSGEREDNADAWIEALSADVVPEKHDTVRTVVHEAIEQRVPILRQLQIVPD